MPSRYIRHSHNPPTDTLDVVKWDISNALPLNVERVNQNTRRRTAPSTATGSGVYVGIAGMSRRIRKTILSRTRRHHFQGSL